MTYLYLCICGIQNGHIEIFYDTLVPIYCYYIKSNSLPFLFLQVWNVKVSKYDPACE